MRCMGYSDRLLAPPGWFGHGLLTRPSSATAVSHRRRATWRPTVGRTAGSGDPRRTRPMVDLTARSGDPRRTKRRTAGSGDLTERNRFATKAVGIRGRSRPTLQHATARLLVANLAWRELTPARDRLQASFTSIHGVPSTSWRSSK